MNGKKLACVVLLMLVGVLAYFGQIAHKKADAKRQEAEAIVSEQSKMQDDLKLAEITTAAMKNESEELRHFVDSWTPHAEKYQTQSEVEQTILASLRNANLLILSQKFEMKAIPSSPFIPKAVRASVVVEDDYAKTLNWLGEIERKMPLARTTNCRLTGGDSGRQVHLEVSLEVPLVDLKFSPVAPPAPGAPAKKA